MNAYGVGRLVSIVPGMTVGASGVAQTGDYEHYVGRYEADGPVCVDVLPGSPGQGFGAFSGWFVVKAIPSWVIVGPDGKVAGHSMMLAEAFQIARKTLPSAEN